MPIVVAPWATFCRRSAAGGEACDAAPPARLRVTSVPIVLSRCFRRVGVRRAPLVLGDGLRQRVDDVAGEHGPSAELFAGELAGAAVEVGAGAGGVEGVDRLREQRGDDAAQHVAGAGLG